MITKDYMPLSTVEREGFKHFIKVGIPKWHLPTRKTVTEWTEKKYTKLSEKLKHTMEKLETYSLSADIWTEEHTTLSYLGITAHYYDEEQEGITSVNFGLKSLNEPHCSEYIAKMLREFGIEWSIDIKKIQVFLTDNAENMKKAIFLYCEDEKKWQPCFAHTLNLVCTDPMKYYQDKKTKEKIPNVPGLVTLIEKVKKIVTYFHRSVTAADKLRAYQISKMEKTEGTALRLIQDISTRWNSTYLMLSRFSELSEAVSCALFACDNGPDMLTSSELRTVRAVCSVLAPLYEVTVEVSAEKSPTASKIIPFVTLMKRGIESLKIDDAVALNLQKFILKRLNERFVDLEGVRAFSAATLLDPRFKKLHFSSALRRTETINFLSRELRKMSSKTNVTQEVALNVDLQDSDSKSSSIWSFHDEIAAEQTIYCDEDEAGGVPIQLRQYMNRPTLPRNGDPFQQWKVLQGEYPQLFTLAMKYLPLISTSVPAERLFSKAGLLATDQRSRLSKSHLSQLLFLNSIPEVMWYSV